MEGNNTPLTFTPSRILIIAMRQLGDVLLVTPVVHSLRISYPSAVLDILVYEGTAAMLAGNPDIDHIITTQQRPKFTDVVQLTRRLFRRYDLAIATQTGDRPILYACLASKFRIGPILVDSDNGRWKRWVLQRWVPFDDNNTHTVLQNLRLISLLSIPQYARLIPPQVTDVSALEERFQFLTDGSGYAVIHPHPMWMYKRWTISGWQSVVRHLQQSGLKLILSGSGSLTELEYLRQIHLDTQNEVINLAGQLTLAELAHIISKAILFVGPDTGITHLAAATGVKTFALFGPTNPIKWAPWPYNFPFKTNPMVKIGNQSVGNVVLIQGKSTAGCVPCHQEGCDKHQSSQSACLDTLMPEFVISVLDQVIKLQVKSPLDQ